MRDPAATNNVAPGSSPQIARRCRRMERVMGIEPIESSRQISDLGCLRDPSAMDVRIFTVRGVLYGNVRQVLHNGPSSRRVSQTMMTARDPYA
jgi:hypothetical protein